MFYYTQNQAKEKGGVEPTPPLQNSKNDITQDVRAEAEALAMDLLWEWAGVWTVSPKTPLPGTSGAKGETLPEEPE
ncbi:MAG: hypothetical protein Q8O97_00145 [bacterium]|nr:hypothetical protein [bacterium]